MNNYIILISFLLIISLITYFLQKKFKSNLIVWAVTIIYAFFAFYQLGSFTNCVTYFQPKAANDSIILKLDETKFDKVALLATEGDTNDYSSYPVNMHVTVSFSNDLNAWEDENTINDAPFNEAVFIEGDFNYQYVKITFNKLYSILNEIAVFNNNQQISLSLYEAPQENIFDPNNIIDEQSYLKAQPTYFDEAYFDEIYHARNAYEIANDFYLYPHVHPLLATSLIALGIKIFGFNPFGYRFFGAIIAILMLPLIYLLTKKIFKKTWVANFATILLASEFMHYTTGRIATLEPMAIFSIILLYYFFYQYYVIDLKVQNQKSLYKYLYLTSLAMSISWAVKWVGIYATIGIVIMYFIKLFKGYNRQNRMLIIKIILLSVIFFVIQPVIIYTLVYLIPRFTRDRPDSIIVLFKEVFDYTIGIYEYHAHVTATHPYSSVWYQWLFDIRPIWYFFKNYDGIISSISCFNNPLISVVGFFAMIYTAFDTFKTKNQKGFFIVIGYLSQLVPWIFITRCVFAYHYYASIPFLILAIVYTINNLVIKDQRYYRLAKIYVIICVLLFLLFLPVLSGLPTTIHYCQTFLRWLESWVFYV